MLTVMSATIIPFPDQSTRQRVIRARFGADALDEQSEAEWYWQADHVLDHIEAMLHTAPAREVMALCEQAVWCLLGAAPDIDDGDAVMALIDRLRDLHLRACRLDLPDPALLAEFVYDLARSDEMGVLWGVIDPYVPLLGEAGLAVMRRRLAAEERTMSRLTPIGRSILEFCLRPVRASLGQLPLG